MRRLTLHEKISLKGKFEAKGLKLPTLDMKNAVHFWAMCYGYRPISRWYVVPRTHFHLGGSNG